MRKSTLIVAVGALLYGIASASPASAQDTTRKASSGEIANAASLASLIMALDATGASVTKFGTLDSLKAADLEFVNAKPLIMENETDFRAARERNATAIADLRTEVAKNDVLVKALAEHNQKLTAENVLALHVQANGRVIVYFVPKM